MAKSMARWAATELRKQSTVCLMVTLTFEGTPATWTGKQCTQAFNGFMNKFKRTYWCRDYLVARELQERGVYHYHMVILGIKWLNFDEVEAMWGHGFVWLTAYDQPASAMRYVLKYVDKGGRLHASIHLLDSLQVRTLVRALKNFASTGWRLCEAFRTGVITFSDYRKMYDLYMVGS